MNLPIMMLSKYFKPIEATDANQSSNPEPDELGELFFPEHLPVDPEPWAIELKYVNQQSHHLESIQGDEGGDESIQVEPAEEVNADQTDGQYADHDIVQKRGMVDFRLATAPGGQNRDERIEKDQREHPVEVLQKKRRLPPVLVQEKSRKIQRMAPASRKPSSGNKLANAKKPWCFRCSS